jgi:hypothetical protein
MCSSRDSFLLNVIPGPANDDVCSAIQLETGRNGPFKNVYASVEKSEPLPDTTDCNTQSSWCNQEGGLQATVWFKFTAAGEVASFTSEGFDTQIALYEAFSCEEINSGNYTILAANDDFFGEEDSYAAAIEKVNVASGNTYFLQLDGSAGGEVGEFYITVLDNALGNLSDKPVKNNVFIYPNPSNGEFKIKISDSPSDISLLILDSQGKAVQTKSYNNLTPGTFEEIFSLSEKGIFLVRISGDGIHHARKVIYQ